MTSTYGCAEEISGRLRGGGLRELVPSSSRNERTKRPTLMKSASSQRSPMRTRCPRRADDSDLELVLALARDEFHRSPAARGLTPRTRQVGWQLHVLRFLEGQIAAPRSRHRRDVHPRPVREVDLRRMRSMNPVSKFAAGSGLFMMNEERDVVMIPSTRYCERASPRAIASSRFSPCTISFESIGS
jgi:hypothetical protein